MIPARSPSTLDNLSYDTDLYVVSKYMQHRRASSGSSAFLLSRVFNSSTVDVGGWTDLNGETLFCALQAV